MSNTELSRLRAWSVLNDFKTLSKLASVLVLLAGLTACDTVKTSFDSWKSTSDTPLVIDRHWDINEPYRKLLIVMVHGFDSTSDNAWGELPSLMKQQKNGDFANFNVVRYGYGTKMCKNRVNIEERGDGLKSFLKDEINKYDGVIFVSHSMGGLVTMYSLIGLAQENNDHLTRLPITVMTFGTPHLGLKAADLLQGLAFLCSDAQAEELTVFNRSSRGRVNEWNSYFGKEASNRYHYHVTVKPYYGADDHFVDPSSACGPFLECDQVDGNHVMMVKPAGTEHLAYKKLISVVRELIVLSPAPAVPTGLTITVQ